MDPLTWTGSLGSILNPALWIVAALLGLSIVAVIILSLFAAPVTLQSNADGTVTAKTGLAGSADATLRAMLLALGAVLLAYIIGGIVMPYGDAGIIGAIARRFLPVWIALVVMFALSVTFKRKLGLYGKLLDSTVGMIGLALVMFWVFTAIFGAAFDLIGTHDAYSQISGMKNEVPGLPVTNAAADGLFPHYLLGGDNLARDVFSRMVHGSGIVIAIAPLATLFAFMVGIRWACLRGITAG